MKKKLMMIMVLGFLVMVLGFGGCSTLQSFFYEMEPFTHEIREDYDFGDAELKNIQYYLSEDIVLTRELSSNESTVTSGHSIKIVNNKRVEEIIFRAGTPGIATFVGEDYFEISFEKGQTLFFWAGDDFAGKYKLYAFNWTNGVGEIHYEDKLFWTNIHFYIIF